MRRKSAFKKEQWKTLILDKQQRNQQEWLPEIQLFPMLDHCWCSWWSALSSIGSSVHFSPKLSWQLNLRFGLLIWITASLNLVLRINISILTPFQNAPKLKKLSGLLIMCFFMVREILICANLSKPDSSPKNHFDSPSTGSGHRAQETVFRDTLKHLWQTNESLLLLRDLQN